MKKFFSFIAVAGFLVACNNDGTTKTTSTDSGTAPNLTNVQNVNGNQPDTTTGIKLDNNQSGDTTKNTNTPNR